MNSELERHVVALGTALAAAISSDFGGCDAIQGLQLKASVIERLARDHAQAVLVVHSRFVWRGG